jgi:hypothetical protein
MTPKIFFGIRPSLLQFFFRSFSAGSDCTEMAGARLELNGASKSRIIVKEPEPVQYHVASSVQKAPALMAPASQGVSENLKEPHHIGGSMEPCSGYSTGSNGSAPATLAPMT